MPSLTSASPELYLRRPPAQNERYRLDAMLKAAAERGVQVYVIVYKEVPQALTCESTSEQPCRNETTAADRRSGLESKTDNPLRRAGLH